jgi:TRAP-type C4-dicarboxylate transport system substrate-binding protein
MSLEVQAALRSASDKAGVQMRSKARQEVNEAVDAMAKRGLKINRPTAEQMQEWDQLAQKLYPRIRGAMVPADTFDEVFAHLKAFRAGK